MKTPRPRLPGRTPPFAQRQCGQVLFIALIVLVALTLTGIALVRAVDTVTLSAGNLSFKKGALMASDTGVEAANAYIAGQPTFVAAAPASGLNADSTANGYYSTYSTPTTPSVPRTIDADASGRPANWPATTTGSVQLAPDASGNTVTYVIQRMCSDNLTTGSDSDRKTKCITEPPQVCHSPPCIFPPPAIYYRITAMIQGPHNTLSYVQTMVRKP